VNKGLDLDLHFGQLSDNRSMTTVMSFAFQSCLIISHLAPDMGKTSDKRGDNRKWHAISNRE